MPAMGIHLGRTLDGIDPAVGNDQRAQRPYVLGAVTPSGNRRADDDDFWDDLDPVQVSMLEALRRIGEPLSAIESVNVLDGYLSMWEAKDHFEALHRAGVVEPISADESSEPSSGFDLPYRLRTADSGNS